MATSWDVGEAAEVRVQPKGGGPEEVRATIVIEDLTDVVTRIAARRGPSGPQAPLTQYILATAADVLAKRLIEDITAKLDREPVPRVLSALVGHEPFVVTTMQISVHHMRRRWPTAADWYDDLISYVLRPQRLAANEASALAHVPAWLALSLGGFVREFAQHQLEATQDPRLFRLAETVEALWPDYPPVEVAARRYRKALVASWVPLYLFLLNHYGLRLCGGVTIEDVVWIFDALVTQEAHQRLVLKDWPLFADPHGHDKRSYTARAGMLFIAGVVEGRGGEAMSIEDLYARAPQPPVPY